MKKEQDLLEEELEQTAHKSLKIVDESDVSSEEGKQAFKNAMDATDRLIQLKKIKIASKQDIENRIVKCVEIGIPIAIFMADAAFKVMYMNKVLNYEKEGVITSSPGKNFVSSLFRFK